MGIRQNIFISIMIHAMAIASMFIVGSRVRGVEYRAPADYMIVSLFKEMAGITTITSQGKKKVKDKNSSVVATSKAILSVIARDEVPLALGHLGRLAAESGSAEAESNLKTKLFADSSTAPATVYSATSGETKMSYTETANNENNSPSLFSGSFRDKGGMGGLPDQSASHDPNYALIRAAIERAKTYPFLARKKRIEGTVITEFAINSKGFPEDIRVRKSSGSEILDSAAMNIITKAAPFPKANRHIVIPITFSLTGNQ